MCHLIPASVLLLRGTGWARGEVWEARGGAGGGAGGERGVAITERGWVREGGERGVVITERRVGRKRCGHY